VSFVDSRFNAQAHPADRPVGIILLVLNALGTCGSLAAIGLGSVVGALGMSGMLSARHTGGGFGALMAVFGIASLVASVVSIVGSIGIMQSRKIGFVIVLAMGVVGLVIHGLSFGSTHSFLGIGLGILAPVYALLRLTGILPPRV